MIKKIFITLGIIILLLILGIAIFLLTFDLNHYRGFVMTQASNALGRPVEIRSMSAKWSLIPTINVEGVRILNDDQKEPLLEVPRLEAIIELTPLVQGQIVVQRITVPEASITWNQPIQRESAQETVSQKENQPNKLASNKLSKIWLDAISIDALHFKIRTEKEYKFDINKLTLNQLSKFSFDFVYQGKTVSASGNFGSILELIQGATSLPVNLTLSQDRANLKINGKINELSTLEKMNFQVTANIPNFKDLFKKWGIQNNKIPSTNVTLKTNFDGDLKKGTIGKTSLTFGKDELVINTQGTLSNLKSNPVADLTSTLSLKNGAISKLWGVKPFDLSSKTTASKERITFSEIQLNAGKSDISGQVYIQLNKKPLFVKGELNSTYFDVYDLIEENKNQTATVNTPAKKDSVLSNKPLPFDLLKQLDGEINLSVAHLKFSKEIMDYANVKTVINLGKGILNMPSQIGIFGGSIQNALKVNANEKEVALETKANNIQVNKIKKLNKNIQNTNVNWLITLNSKGNSLHDLAANANGNISAELTEGQIINKWFNSLPATLDLLRRGNLLAFSTQDQKTELICGALNVPVKNGVITSQDQIALETNTLNFVVNGQVDLKNETVDLTMIPSIGQTRGMANELLNVAQAVKLVGPWTNITPKTEPMQAVDTLAKALGQKLTGQQQEKVQSKPIALCQKVLGRSISKTQKATPQKQTTQKQTQVQPQQKKPDLKQQLIQSLSQALTDQVAPSKKQ